jgi:hypothetical protein
MFSHPLPVIEPALLRVRAFAFSNLTALLFSVAFGAGLLSVILWMQEVWGYSSIKTGFAIAPGPLIVPVFAALSQRVAGRVPVGLIAAAGCALFAVGNVVLLSGVGSESHYASEILPGWLIGGAGVGLALPTILSAATTDLPLARSATGSAIINMSRQIGTVLGVSALVALIATPTGFAHAHAVFRHGWWTIAAAGAVAAVSALGMTPNAASPQTSVAHSTA